MLTDYELADQQHTGLDIIQETCAQRCVLVTSHYNKEDVIKLAVALNTKVLPKLLAAEVEITMVD